MPCSPGMKACHRQCLHRNLVNDYRWARLRWEEQRENGEHMQMEDDEYRQQYPAPTFKAWLQGSRNQ